MSPGMFMTRSIAALAMAAALIGAAPPPALAACGAAADAACVARETVAAAREAEHPLVRMRLLSEAARLLPAGEAAPLLAELRAGAEAFEDPGNRSAALMQLAGIMSALGMPEGPALARRLAAAIFEDGPNDRMMIQVLGREGAAAEQIKHIANFQAMHGDLEGAGIAIGYQHSEAGKVDTMFAVAEALVMRGDDAADAMLRQAMRRLAGIADADRADEIKLTAVGALTRAGWVDEALALAETTARITPRIDAVGIVTERLAEAGEVDRAHEQYRRIAGLSANDNALWALVRAVARAGGMVEARALLRDIRMPTTRDQAAGDLAAIQAGGGDLDGALDIIADLPEGFARNRGLRLVLIALAEGGRPDLAQDYAAGLADPGLRNLVVAPIAAARARAGDLEQALATARAQPTPQTRAQTLLAVAQALAQKEAAAGK